jgi:hypothetical protein
MVPTKLAARFPGRGTSTGPERYPGHWSNVLTTVSKSWYRHPLPAITRSVDRVKLDILGIIRKLFVMAKCGIHPNIMTRSGVGGNRWSPRAEVKAVAKKVRRAQDKAASKSE